MACFHPLKAYRGPGGRIAFDSKRGFSDRHLELPCGQCMGCRLARSESWALRCMHEASLQDDNCFVTLTYDQAHVPKDGSLRLVDLQRFWKRLRKAGRAFRYFACGEYGEQTFRPHYHAILFGESFPDKGRVEIGGKPMYVSPFLTETWGAGHCTVDQVTFKSAAYVARYCMKKVTGEQAAEHYQRMDLGTGEVWYVKPEFAVMSRRPHGIGAQWFHRFRDDVFPVDEVVHEGRRHRPPRYYDSLNQVLDPEGHESIRSERRARVAELAADLTPERLEAKEAICASRLSRLRRSL